MKLTKQETTLINFIRTLDFDDVLDAYTGIETVKKDAETQAIVTAYKGNHVVSKGFADRAAKLERLAHFLGEANADYRRHVCGEEHDFIDFDIHASKNTAARFEELASKLREGWVLERIQDNVDNDGCYYFTLIRSEGE